VEPIYASTSAVSDSAKTSIWMWARTSRAPCNAPFRRRWLDDATLHNARGRALEISHAEYSDTVLAYLDPAQREQLQDEDTWIARQLFVGDLIDQILAVPPETIT